MKFLRNPEVLKTLLLYLILSLAASAAAYQWNSRFGYFTAALCTVFVAVWFFATYRRYKKISDLSADIDRILHGKNCTTLENCSEGELGILQSEIYKMTVRLREQQQRLKEDKIYLADSIADISHQIRTPLTSINLLLSLLSEPGVSDGRRGELTRELYDLLSRIDWLITALLKISKLDAGTVSLKSEQITLEELIKRSVSPLMIPIELRAQKLKITAEGVFTGDISWTAEAITNIVKNCMEHTPASGTIEISALENPLFSEIIITDSGSGIDGDDLPHIFERFYKGKNSDGKSFGIGLALARMIITSQNGTVKAENRAEGGARFTVRFYKGVV